MTSSRQRPRALVFDWDNTLIDSWPAIHDANNHTLESFGLPPWTFEETKARVRKSMRDSYPELFGDRWEEAGRVFYERFAARHLVTVTPLPGAEAMLAALRAAGFYLGVVSNKKGDYLRDEARHLGWDGFFGRIVGAFDADRDKPAPEPVYLALEGSGVQAGPDVWFVGDTGVDMECGLNAGCIPVLVRETPPIDEEFSAFPPAIHVGSCEALSILVRSL
ncbi:MAG: HAD family hydrolase [Magnetospirillum sp. WYHS-4]